VHKKDLSYLENLKQKLEGQKRSLESQIGETLDGRKDYAGAAGLVRKLMFLQKIDDEIDAAYERIE
jgi:DnaJ-domain-containing protein 1